MIRTARFTQLLAALCIVAAVFLSGCATLGQATNTSKLVVQVATMKVIEAQPDRAARAAKVLEITADAQKLIDMNGLTVGLLKTAVQDRLAAQNLEPSDRLLANLLVDAVVTDLAAKVGDGLIPPDQLVTVNQVLGWVADAAAFY